MREFYDDSAGSGQIGKRASNDPKTLFHRVALVPDVYVAGSELGRPVWRQLIQTAGCRVDRRSSLTMTKSARRRRLW